MQLSNGNNGAQRTRKASYILSEVEQSFTKLPNARHIDARGLRKLAKKGKVKFSTPAAVSAMERLLLHLVRQVRAAFMRKSIGGIDRKNRITNEFYDRVLDTVLVEQCASQCSAELGASLFGPFAVLFHPHLLQRKHGSSSLLVNQAIACAISSR